MRTGREAHRYATELLTKHGIAATPQRLVIVEELAREDNDATAAQLYDRLRRKGVSIGQATVYRTLALIHEKGAVDTLTHHAAELCYRLCNEGHHHHLMCTGCHRVVELDDCDLDSWVRESAIRHGFVPTSHELEIVGVCADCRSLT